MSLPINENGSLKKGFGNNKSNYSLNKLFESQIQNLNPSSGKGFEIRICHIQNSSNVKRFVIEKNFQILFRVTHFEDDHRSHFLDSRDYIVDIQELNETTSFYPPLYSV